MAEQRWIKPQLLGPTKELATSQVNRHSVPNQGLVCGAKIYPYGLEKETTPQLRLKQMSNKVNSPVSTPPHYNTN